MPTIIGIVVVVLVLIVAAIVFIATRPEGFRIERTAQIGAPPEDVFSIMNNLREWGRWSPYDKRDPNMKKTFEGPAAGPGATYTWNGNNEVGEGRMTIVNSKPGEVVTMKLEFSRPFKATNEVNFKLVPSAPGTGLAGSWTGRTTSFSRRCRYSWTWTRWSAKTSKRVLPISMPWRGPKRRRPGRHPSRPDSREGSVAGSSARVECWNSSPHWKEIIVEWSTQTSGVSKWMLWSGRVLSALPVLMLVISAVMKFTNSPAVVKGFTDFGFDTKLLPGLGITELICTALYVIPQTSVLGAILLTGYLGGAVATHLRVGDRVHRPGRFRSLRVAWTRLARCSVAHAPAVANKPGTVRDVSTRGRLRNARKENG